MSAKERKRLAVMSKAHEGEITIKEASAALGLSYRQGRRVYRRYVDEGDEGLIHRGRGKPSNRGIPVENKDAILAAYRKTYSDFGPTLASEKLYEREGFCVNHETLRRWLIDAGLWQRCRKRPHHRKRRERMAHFGELVQMDGSHHRWFAGSEEESCLMDMVDDATGTTLPLMSEEETTKSAMEVLWAWVLKYGIPQALYVDHKNVYVTGREPTLEEQLSGDIPLTQFGRVCKKLGIEIIPAGSPQAKGRVERKHGVYQDRLVKELRLAGIRDIASANEFLPAYADTLNKRFAIEPLNSSDFHVPVSGDVNLASVFCMEETRTVANDWVVSYQNRLFQILPQRELPPAGSKVIVSEHLDGSIHLTYKRIELDCEEIASRPARRRDMPSAVRHETKRIPPPDHPWRRLNSEYLNDAREPALV